MEAKTIGEVLDLQLAMFKEVDRGCKKVRKYEKKTKERVRYQIGGGIGLILLYFDEKKEDFYRNASDVNLMLHESSTPIFFDVLENDGYEIKRRDTTEFGARKVIERPRNKGEMELKINGIIVYPDGDGNIMFDYRDMGHILKLPEALCHNKPVVRRIRDDEIEIRLVPPHLQRLGKELRTTPKENDNEDLKYLNEIVNNNPHYSSLYDSTIRELKKQGIMPRR